MTQTEQFRHLALPPTGTGPGVLVLHPWWGLNEFIRSFCDRLAEQGFVALAPDLYHGRIARTIPEAEQMVNQYDQQQAGGEILAAVEDLQKLTAFAGSRVGVVGFSMGAFWALWLANFRPESVQAVTLFYGTGDGEYANSQAAYQGHFAADDPFEALEYVQATEQSLRATGKPVEFFTYPGTGHWFFEADREDAYQPEAAQLAWERTLAFLRKHLGGKL